MIKNTLTILAIFLLTACSQSPFPADSLVIEKNSPAIINGVLNEPIGIETLGGVFTPLIEPGTTVPCTHTEIFSTAADNQDQIMITLYRGEEKLVSDNTQIGKYQIQEIPPAPRGEPQIQISFIVSDADIRLHAKDLATDKTMKIVEKKE